MSLRVSGLGFRVQGPARTGLITTLFSALERMTNHPRDILPTDYSLKKEPRAKARGSQLKANG